MALYHRGLRLRAGRQVLSDLTSELLRTAAFHFLLGTPETEAYARQLLREITTAPPAQGKQLLWIHTTPYWVAPLRHLFAQSTRVQVAACDMSYEGIVEADPTKPYESMARRLVYSPFNGPAQRRIDRALEMAKTVGADGAVWFCHWGCKHTLGGARLGKTISSYREAFFTEDRAYPGQQYRTYSPQDLSLIHISVLPGQGAVLRPGS